MASTDQTEGTMDKKNLESTFKTLAEAIRDQTVEDTRSHTMKLFGELERTIGEQSKLAQEEFASLKAASDYLKEELEKTSKKINSNFDLDTINSELHNQIGTNRGELLTIVDDLNNRVMKLEKSMTDQIKSLTELIKSIPPPKIELTIPKKGKIKKQMQYDDFGRIREVYEEEVD